MVVTDPLFEMAYSRKDAIEICNDKGRQFVSHFNKIYNEDNNETKLHHASEMQSWINDISRMKLTYNNKPLNEKNIYDWFITCGQLVSDLFDDQYEAEVYDDFVTYLLDYEDKNVINALKKINLIY